MKNLCDKLRLRSSWIDLKSKSFWNGLPLEVIGTMFLYISIWSNIYVGNGGLAVGLAAGLTLTALILIISPISGCDLNPSLSFALLLTRHISLIKFCFHCCMDILGSYLTHVFLMGVFDKRVINIQPNYIKSPWHGMIMEAVLTYLLILIIFTVKDTNRWGDSGRIFGPFAVGFIDAANTIGFLNSTGGAMNPAGPIGYCLYYKKWNNLWLYVVGPLIGASIAGLHYEFFISANASVEKFKEWLLNPSFYIHKASFEKENKKLNISEF